MILPLYALKSVGGTDARSYCNVRQGPITYAPDYGSPLTNRDVCMSHANEPYTCSRTRLLVVREYYNVFFETDTRQGSFDRFTDGCFIIPSFDEPPNASWQYAGARIPFKAGVYAHTRPNISAMA